MHKQAAHHCNATIKILGYLVVSKMYYWYCIKFNRLCVDGWGSYRDNLTSPHLHTMSLLANSFVPARLPLPLLIPNFGKGCFFTLNRVLLFRFLKDQDCPPPQRKSGFSLNHWCPWLEGIKRTRILGMCQDCPLEISGPLSEQSLNHDPNAEGLQRWTLVIVIYCASQYFLVKLGEDNWQFWYVYPENRAWQLLHGKEL